MKYLRITDELFLVQQPVTTVKVEPVKNINHIWIVDQSGSMYGELPRVIDDLKKRTRSLRKGDILSFGLFSSEGGDYRFPFKGFTINNDSDLVKLDKIFDANRQARNLTCFSEILIDAVTVIEDLTPLNPNFSLMFFSDGYPVVSKFYKEIEKIKFALSTLSAKVSSALLVGYGSYFNKELMGTMAETIGGALVSSRNVQVFAESMDRFLLDAGTANPKHTVKLSEKSVYPFAISLTDNNVVSLGIEDGKVNYSPTRDNSIYYLSELKQNKAGEFFIPNATNIMVHNHLVDAAYAFALALIQRTKVSAALDILSVLGDKALISRTYNAFTNDEYTAVENRINAAVFDSGGRLSEGRDTHFLPPKDAFCLVDAIDLLLEDEDSRFYPRDPAFSYQKIGRGSKVLDGYPKFVYGENPYSLISDLVWNKSKLNLSVLSKTDGTIELNGDFAGNGFAKVYPTFVWRNYALVSDGLLNTPLLPVSHISETTYDKFREVGIIGNYAYSPEAKFILDLTAVPVMNRAMAEGRTSAKELAKQIFREKQLEGRLKALKFFQDQLNPDKKTVGSLLTDAQQAFLESNGIGKDGSFSPKSEQIEATDYYFVKSFLVKVGGLSNLPKVDDVITKLDTGKKLTISDNLLAPTILEWQKATESKFRSPLTWTEREIKTAKLELKSLRREIQRTKFAILLGKAWFDEFESREDNKIKLDEVEFTFEYRDNVKVTI